ncbi:S8/S53 family peptidase [Pseudonocardia sp. CA-107938]|uniref:S8/S53 family peptidase n=1 Tax=Pseudonocardia sp. CA-107938 TaxID=3240021 RepID=UPI003D930EF4
MASPDRTRDPRFWTQLDIVMAAAAERGITIGYEWSPGRDRETLTPDLLFEHDAILVPARYVDSLPADLRGNAVSGRGVSSPRADRNTDDDLLLVNTGGDRAPETIERLERDGVERGALRPNHLISITGGCVCPATEPIRVDGAAKPLPRQSPDDAGDGVFVQVVDTGIWDGFGDGRPWFHDASGLDVEEVTGVPRSGGGLGRLEVGGNKRSGTIVDGVIGEYVGHGVFVAGVLRCVAPGTRVFVSNALAWAGAVMEDTLGQDMVRGLVQAIEQGDPPDIISLSAGSATFCDLPYAGLRAFFTEMERPDCTTLLVAAAGNEGETHKFYPAALAVDRPDMVVGVGALRGDGWGRACFTNYGDWVSVYAPGERLVNAYLKGTYRYIDPPQLSATGAPACRYYTPALYGGCSCTDAPPQHSEQEFDGMAEWSGTSFSTPYVAGRIAAFMHATGEKNARVAARALLRTLPSVVDAEDGFVLTKVIH